MAAAPIIQSVQLKGHQAAVTCLDHSSTTVAGGSISNRNSLLLSGSEDGTCRLWDLRIGRTVTCIKCRDSHSASGGQQEQEILSVAFGPSWKNMTGSTATVIEESPFAHDFSVYASVGNCVYGYDLRKVSSPIITEPSVDLSDLLEAPDDVNQIAFSPIRAPAPILINNKKGGRKKSTNQKSTSVYSSPSIHLATVDDGGTVRVTADWTFSGKHTGSGKQRRVLCHGEDVMVTSMAYAPRNVSNGSGKQQYLASGGTDCCIRIWDVALQAQQTKPVASIILSNTDTGANQVCNPPMVHSLNYSPSGRLLAAGLGDGSIAIVQGQVVTARMEDAHTGSVASCLFPAWNSTTGSSHAITAHDRLLCSIGNDGCIVLWDLGVTIAGNKATNPTHYLPIPSSTTTTHVSSSAQDELLSRPTSHAVEYDDQNSNDAELDQPQTIFAFQHTAGKPNWMVSGRAHDPVFASSLFVADTTKDISIYTIPLQ